MPTQFEQALGYIDGTIAAEGSFQKGLAYDMTASGLVPYTDAVPAPPNEKGLVGVCIGPGRLLTEVHIADLMVMPGTSALIRGDVIQLPGLGVAFPAYVPGHFCAAKDFPVPSPLPRVATVIADSPATPEARLVRCLYFGLGVLGGSFAVE